MDYLLFNHLVKGYSTIHPYWLSQILDLAVLLSSWVPWLWEKCFCCLVWLPLSWFHWDSYFLEPTGQHPEERIPTRHMQAGLSRQAFFGFWIGSEPAALSPIASSFGDSWAYRSCHSSCRHESTEDSRFCHEATTSRSSLCSFSDSQNTLLIRHFLYCLIVVPFICPKLLLDLQLAHL